MTGKITYTPFISKPIPESSALSPIPISFPISEYRGADPDQEVIPIQYTPSKPEPEVETTTEKSFNPFKWARLMLRSSEPSARKTSTKTSTKTSAKTYSDNESV